MNKKALSKKQCEDLLITLQTRFEKNMKRHRFIDWDTIKSKIENNPEKLWSLYQMEETWWEPDVIWFAEESWEYLFCDCSQESPSGRRNLCYDIEALESRKKFKPQDSAIEVAKSMWTELLSEDEYKYLQKLWNFDTKTSSWLKTPSEIRDLWWAIFGDNRYETVFIYHNGAESYYAARWFRWKLIV